MISDTKPEIAKRAISRISQWRKGLWGYNVWQGLFPKIRIRIITMHKMEKATTKPPIPQSKAIHHNSPLNNFPINKAINEPKPRIKLNAKIISVSFRTPKKCSWGLHPFGLTESPANRIRENKYLRKRFDEST